MRWYAVLFWIWVLVSLGIFVWRRINGSGSSDENGAADSDRVDPLLKEWAPPPTEPGEAVEGAADTSEAGVPPATAEQVASSTDAPAPASASVRAPAATPTPRATLAQLLAGITLPHGLVPLTQLGRSVDLDSEIIVATDSATPEAVGAALADEIERLGFTVRSTGDQTAVADGERGSIEIEIHPDATRAVDGGSPRFPTAAPGMVVVELRVVPPARIR